MYEYRWHTLEMSRKLQHRECLRQRITGDKLYADASETACTFSQGGSPRSLKHCAPHGNPPLSLHRIDRLRWLLGDCKASEMGGVSDVRLNEPGPICQDSKKRRSFAGEYACLGMRSLRVWFRKSTRLGVNSGTKAEMSHGKCEDQGASSDCLSTRPGVSCRGEAVSPQRAPKPRLHPWDTSVFVPESRARGVLFARRSKIPTEYQEDIEASWPIGRAVELACSPA